MVKIENKVYPMQSSHTILVIRQVRHVAIWGSLWEKVQNPSDVVKSGRAFVSWTSPHKGSRRKSSRNPQKVESSLVQTEELRGQEETRNKFQFRRLHLLLVPTNVTWWWRPQTPSLGSSISWTTNKSTSARNTAVAFYPGVYRDVIYISAEKTVSEEI